ncbi:hypothetical protein FHL06_13515 [Lactobacillus halodurans]|uniref:Uncharacterized protein n=1 Tax=Companilactobacillus halodurans TaxID=2584183 RepID=A0A5P0ZSW3_9LACO|nr:hypothetical protein [Companilactobacillus halodurans]MQS77328.1 hypothetical protein [Companilactobacillus halodurans]
MKIAVQLDSDRNILFVNDTSEDGAKSQVKLFSDKGWTLVESDPAFSIDQKYLWTVRESDGKLVHIATNLTPDEESQKSNTELTNLVIDQETDIEQIKQSITELTNNQLKNNTSEISDKQEETK